MTEVIRINASRPGAAGIKKAALVLKKGGLVAFPTETVYGLGANLLDKKAVGKVYEIKKRPRNKPLTVHVADTASVRKITGNIPLRAAKLIKKYWPGP